MPRLVLRVTELLEIASVAFGFAGDANLAAMVDELVGEGNPAILRDDAHQFLLDFWRCVTLGQA